MESDNFKVTKVKRSISGHELHHGWKIIIKLIAKRAKRKETLLPLSSCSIETTDSNVPIAGKKKTRQKAQIKEPYKKRTPQIFRETIIPGASALIAAENPVTFRDARLCQRGKSIGSLDKARTRPLRARARTRKREKRRRRRRRRRSRDFYLSPRDLCSRAKSAAAGAPKKRALHFRSLYGRRDTAKLLHCAIAQRRLC